MVTFAEVRQARPETYRRAAQAWAQLVEAIDEQGVQVRNRGAALAFSWSGAAGQAATGHLDELAGEFGAGATRAGEIPTILDEHAARVAAAKVTLDRTVAAVAGTPILISPAGAVSLSPQAYRVPALVPLWQRLASQVQTVIDGAVREATAADTSTTSRLNAVLPTTAVTEPTGPAGQIPARGTDPRTVNRWWNGLTADQRAWLLANHPERIGNLDGVPAAARDQANRAVLATTRAALEQRRAELAARGEDRSDAEDDELDGINDKLRGIEAISGRLDDTGVGKQRAYLLGFDTDGSDSRGYAIVAMGNPDTADNVVTFVPGTGTRLGSIGGDLGRADIMVDSARAADPSETTAAIVWVGYDAPQDVINTDLGHLGEDATSDRYALGARDALDRFEDGLRVTHEGSSGAGVPQDHRSHNTVLGHSYGSTVVGYTARDRGLDTNELIFVGSPGVGVQHARDLGVPPEHVWSSTARNDPIQYGYDFGDLVRAGVGLDPQVDLVHGANPSSPEFGGQVFAADPGDPIVRWKWERHGPFGGIPVPVPHFSANAHSQYWDPGSASLENMGQIIVGNRPTRRVP